MHCDTAQEWIATGWVEELSETVVSDLQMHLQSCPACREHAAALGELWEELGRLPAPEPGQAVSQRFDQMVQAYRIGAAGHARPRAMSPYWQMAAAAALLVMGVAAGHLYSERSHDAEKIAALSTDLQQMRQLVAVSLLQQPSAVERLRGVGFSREMSSASGEVTDALFEALNHDSNINVRLSAVDALRQVATREVAVKRLRQTILSQESPLVQMSLIDWALDVHDPDALRALSGAQRAAELDPAVAARLASALTRVQ